MREPAFSGLRLAGGTALALQLGHRKSVDIDLFGKVEFESADVQHLFSGYRQVAPLKRSANINIFVLDGVKVDFVNYAYPWLEPMIEYNKIRLAGVPDIAAMKLAAITGRGSRKDFVDLFFLLKEYTLASLLEFYQAKFPDGSIFLVLKSLTWFDDAETDADVMLQPAYKASVDWNLVKQTILKAVEGYI